MCVCVRRNLQKRQRSIARQQIENSEKIPNITQHTAKVYPSHFTVNRNLVTKKPLLFQTHLRSIHKRDLARHMHE